MIEQIDIHKFRGIRAGKLDRLRQFNLFVGPNNAGKSAIVEAVYLAAAADRPANLVISDGGRSESYSVTLPAKDMLGQHPFDHLAKRHQYAAVANDSNRLEQEVLQITIADRQLPIRTFELTANGEPLTEDDARQVNLFRLPPDPEQAVRLADLATQLSDRPVENWPEDQQLTFCWQRELTYFYKGSASWWVSGSLPPAHHVLSCDMLTVQEHLPATFYEKMLSTVPGWTQEITRRFGRIFGLSQSFTVQFLPTKEEQPAIQGWIAPAESAAVPIDAWGDGARAAFKILTPLIALAHLATPDQPGLLLWEEPEMFQNPQTLGNFLREVVDIVHDKPIQIFMVSHSLEVIAHITQMLQENVLPDDKTLAFLINLQEGQLQSTWFDAGNLLSWLETGLDPRIWDEFVPPVQFRLSPEAEE